MSDYDKLRDDVAHLKSTDQENRQLRDIRRDYEVKINNLEERNADLEIKI